MQVENEPEDQAILHFHVHESECNVPRFMTYNQVWVTKAVGGRLLESCGVIDERPNCLANCLFAEVTRALWCVAC